MTTVALLALGLGLGLADARAADAPRTSPALTCEGENYAAAVVRAQKVFDSRSAGTTVPHTNAASAVFATRVNQAYGLAARLVTCDAAPDRARNHARRILAATAYKSRDIELPEAEVKRRLATAEREMRRCLALAPHDPECITWHASTRGRLAQYSWSPLLVTLPRSLLAEFRAARADLAPGHDLRDGAATRGEASILLRAPAFLGGNRTAARVLMETAAAAPRFPCSVANRLLLAETRTRTGDTDGGLAELRATVAAGLPECALQRYENVSALEEAQRCLQRIEADPTLTTTWPYECE